MAANIEKISNNQKLSTMSKDELKVVSIGLIDWLDKLLSLKGEESAKRLEVLLPAISECAMAYTKEELFECFTLYVKGQLDIEPIDNYLTVIHFNKILNSYKRWRQVKFIQESKVNYKPFEPSEEAKKEMILEALKEAFVDYQLTGSVSLSKAYLYDVLYKRGYLPTDLKTKNEIYLEAKKNVENFKRESKDDSFMGIKRIIVNSGLNSSITTECYRLSLERFFSNLENINEVLI